MTAPPVPDTLPEDAARLIELVRARRAHAARHLRAVNARVHRAPALEPPLDPATEIDSTSADEPARRLRLVSVPPAHRLVVPDEPLPFEEAPPAAAPRATAQRSGPRPPQPASGSYRSERGTPPAYDDDFWSPQPTSRRQLPEPTPIAWHFLQALLETFAGRRPLGQLRAWVSPAIYGGLARAATPGRPAGPPSGGASSTVGAPGTVRSVRVCEPADGVAEISAVVRHGGRYRAVAARFEGIDGRWRCVLLQVG